ncbi:ADP-ribosylation factor-like protein [Candidatus Lokiarchaeum ossiferum]|uniref:ADP-ribosylation factor-like protein n=1 Tax=Candidatus Lokiarchaeum ossiferum TaxID=2951803 RepID=UPI00352C3E3F
MVIGLVLTHWDTQLGPLIMARYPNNFQVSKDEINKILMTHSISKEMTNEIIEIRLKEKIFLSYCPKKQIPVNGYSMMIIVLNLNEKLLFDGIKNQLNEIGENLFNRSGNEQIKEFHHYASKFFQKKSSRKILFIGSSAVGKTSIKKLFFEGIPSESLLDLPLEPTYGLVQFNYDWLDLDLGVADLAGQEMDHFLNESFESEIDPFDSVDAILYIFDSTYWDTNSREIVQHIQKIQDINTNRDLKSQFFVFCHKLDLIPTCDQQSFKNEIKYTLPASVQSNLFFTSIKSSMLHQLIRSMQVVIGTLSPQTNYLEEILFETISEKKNTAVIILNEKRILLSASTEDFKIINYSHIFSFISSMNLLLDDFKSEFTQLQLKGNRFNLHFSSIEWLSEGECIILISECLSFKELSLLKESIQYSLIYLETSYEKSSDNLSIDQKNSSK